MGAVRADISGLDHEVASNLLLDIDIPLLRVAIGVADVEQRAGGALRRRVEIDGRRRRETVVDAQGGKQRGGKGRREQVRRVLRLAAGTARKRVAPGNSIAAPQNRLSAAENVVRHADAWRPIPLVGIHESTSDFLAGDRGVVGSPHESASHRIEIRLPVGNLDRRREVFVAQSEIQRQSLRHPVIVLHVGAVFPLALAGNAEQQRAADAGRITQDETRHGESGIRIDGAAGGDAGAIGRQRSRRN